MKKRRLRTALTLLSIVLMVSGLVGFTSLSAVTVTRNIPHPTGVPAYDGIYLHLYEWGRGYEEIGEQVEGYLSEIFSDIAIIAPRCWKYTDFRSVIPGYASPYMGMFRITMGDKTVHPRALLGLSAYEAELTHADSYLVAGRWFIPNDRFTCIITERQAELLGINVTTFNAGAPPTVKIEGMLFTVVGIVSNEFETLKDLDGEAITPLKFDYPPAVPNPWNEHIRYWEFLIVDYPTLVLMGGETVSFSIKIINATEDLVTEYARDLYTILPKYAYFISYGGGVYKYGRGTTMQIGGFQMQSVPMSLVGLAVFNILLGNVYERKREIYIYSTVGISPRNIFFFFLAETIVYALVGGVTGYLTGISEIRIVPTFLPGIFEMVNYSSGIVLIAIGGAMLATIVSAIYPAYISSRLVTPSLERAWSIPTKPVGDNWEIPLPFIAHSGTEMKGILSFIEEFLRQHMQAEAPIFSVSELKRVEGTRKIRNREVPFESLSFECRLSPYSAGVTQSMEIVAMQVAPTRWEHAFIIRRLSGSFGDWTRLNRSALNSVRQQFLLWRSLKEEERKRYLST